MNAVVTGAIGLALGAVLAGFAVAACYRAAAKAQIRQKLSLLSGAAQQLRAPLNDVLGLAQTLALRAGEFSPTNKELIETIAGAGANVKGALLDVLDILDFESGQIRINRTVELLPEIVDFLRRANQRRGSALGVVLDIDLKASARAWFLIDTLRLRQCVGAMVRHCVTHSGAKQVKVVIEAGRRPKHWAKERLIVVTVSDDSPGMAQEAAERFFLSPNDRRNFSRTRAGFAPLNLIVARIMAREMGGELTVTSAPGEGMTFQLHVPAKFARGANENSKASDLAPLDVATRVLRGKVILAVEDNTVNMRVLQAFLSRLQPANILTAVNGEEALKVLQRKKCDVVLMDMQMPAMDGFSATRIIRATDAPWRNIPIIAISAGATGDEREACLRAGVNSFLPKPVSAEELYERLARVCEG